VWAGGWAGEGGGGVEEEFGALVFPEFVGEGEDDD